MRSSRQKPLLLIATLALGLVSLFVSPLYAAKITNRSVQLTNPRPLETTDHLYTFDFPSASSIGSIVFLYCEDTAVEDGPCTPPPGFDATGASLDFQDGETGFSVHGNTTSNRLVLSRSPSVVTPQTGTYVLGNMVNPSEANDTVYVRTYLHGSDDGTGGYVDFGAMAFSTSESLNIEAFVPPYLLFCTALSVSLDCTSQTGNFIDFGELTSTLPATATSQYSGATNDGSGYTVSVHGTTMTSGNNVIPPLNSQNPSNTGVNQFGINVRDNSNPNVGNNPTGPGSASAASNYNTPNLYRFRSGDLLSSASISTSYDRFTVSYLVNVDNDQPPGVYATTLTYVALASF